MTFASNLIQNQLQSFYIIIQFRQQSMQPKQFELERCRRTPEGGKQAQRRLNAGIVVDSAPGRQIKESDTASGCSSAERRTYRSHAAQHQQTWTFRPWVLAACILTDIYLPLVRAAYLSPGPQIIGAFGDYCDTIGTAFDNVNHPGWFVFAVAGQTYSERYAFGQGTLTACSTIPIPFLQVINNGLLHAHYVVTDSVQIGSTLGRYNQFTAIVFPDRQNFTSNENWYTMAAVLEFTDMAGNTINAGTTVMLWRVWQSFGIIGVRVIDHAPPVRDDINLRNGNSDWAIHNAFEFFYKGSDRLKFETRIVYLEYGTEYKHWIDTTTLEDAYGGKVMMRSNANEIMGGSMRYPGRTGFIPVFFDRETARLNYMLPDSDAAPYYTIDKMEAMHVGLPAIYGFSVPRDLNFNILSQAHPIQIFRFLYGGQPLSCAGGTHQYLLSYLVKIKTDQPDKFITPVYLSWDFGSYVQIIFHASSTLSSSLSLDGTLNNYIGYAEVPLDIWCNPDLGFYIGSFGGSLVTATYTEQALDWTTHGTHHYYGRHCYTPTGLSPPTHCHFIDGSIKQHDDNSKNLLYMTTQDRWYNDQSYHEIGIFLPTDSTAHITYPNGDGTNNGKFIAVSHNVESIVTGNVNFYGNLPGFGTEYTKILYNYPKTYNNVAVESPNSLHSTVTPSVCDTQTYTMGQVASGVLGATRYHLQTWKDDSFGDQISVVMPFTYTCTGSFCNQCPYKIRYHASEGIDGVYSVNAAYTPSRVLRDKTTNNLQISFVDKTYGKAFNMQLIAYYITYYDNGAVQKINSQFSFAINIGLTYHYPDCNTIGSCIIGGLFQIPMRIYQLHDQGGGCYEALTNCAGCLPSAASHPAHLRPMTCPTRECQANDTMTISATEAYDWDITDLPKTFDITTNIVSATSLTKDLFRVGNGTHLDFVAFNTTFDGLFTVAGSSVTINAVANSLEFETETFQVEVKSTTCAFLDNTLKTQADYEASLSDTALNLPTIGVPFQLRLQRCGHQTLSLADATPRYFEIQKDSASHFQAFSNVEKAALFTLAQPTFCPIHLYSLVDELKANFTSSGRRLQATSQEVQNFLQFSTWDQATPLMIDTTFTQTTNELQKVIKFHLAAQTKGKVRFNQIQYQPVTLVIGCFAETYMKAEVKALPILTNDQVVVQQPDAAIPDSTVTPHVKIKLFKELNATANATEQVQTFNLTELIHWETQVPNCYASNLTMYSDALLTQIDTDTKVYLNQNPINKNESGLIDPVLTVNKMAEFNKLIYLKGSTNNGLYSDVFIANVIVCGQEQIALATTQEMKIRQYQLFNILWNQEPDQPEWEVFNLTGMFVVTSSQPNVLTADCPLDYYVICNSSVAVCDKDTNITTNDTFIVNRTTDGDFLYIKRDPLEKQTFQITASTRSGVSITEKIGLQICGKENITVNENYLSLRSGQLDVIKDMDVDTLDEYDLSKIFLNDLPECPIVKYVLVKDAKLDANEISKNQLNNYVVDENNDKFQIVPSIQSKLEFYLMAYTESGKFGTVKISSKIFKLIPPPNDFPKYSDLPEEVKLEIVYDEFGVLQTTKLDMIVSGDLVDVEDDEVQLLSIKNPLNYATVEQGEFNFELVFDPTLINKVTDEGCKEVIIEVTDSGHVNDEVGEQTLKICIEIKQLEPKPEPAPPPPPPVESTFTWDWEAIDRVEEEEEEIIEIPVIEEVWEPLLCEISITTLGKVTFGCNQAIKIEKLTSQIGRRLQDADDSFFSLSMEPGAYEGSEKANLGDLEFVWELEEYDEFNNALMMQVNFTNAIAISPDVIPDILTVDVPDPTVLESRKYGKPLEMGGQPIATGVKKQMPNTVATQNFDSGTQSTNTAMSGTTILTFLMNFIFAGAMKEIIGSILGLQIVLFGSLIFVKMPGNIATYYQRLKPIATFNIVVALQKVTDYVFHYDTPEQIKLREKIIQTAQDLNIKYHNALKNLGNFLFLLGFYFSKVWKLVWLYFKRRVVHKLKRRPITAQIEALKKELFYNKIIQICTAGFIPISISVYFQFRGSMFSTFGEISGVVAGVISFALAYLLLPFALIQAVVVNKETLVNPEFKQKWGASYAGIKTDTRWQRAHKLIFIGRRFALLYIGLEMHRIPPIQLVLMNIMNIFSIIYIGNTEPLLTPFAQKMELFNEAMVSSITYHLFMFTDALPSATAQYLIGWSLVVNLTLMLSINSFFVIKGILNNFRLLIVKKYKVYQLKKAMKDQIKNQFQLKMQQQKAMMLKNQKKEAKREANAKKTREFIKMISDPLAYMHNATPQQKKKLYSYKKRKSTKLSVIHEESMETSKILADRIELDPPRRQKVEEPRIEDIIELDYMPEPKSPDDETKARIKSMLIRKMMSDPEMRQSLEEKFANQVEQTSQGQETVEDQLFEQKLNQLIIEGTGSQEGKEARGISEIGGENEDIVKNDVKKLGLARAGPEMQRARTVMPEAEEAELSPYGKELARILEEGFAHKASQADKSIKRRKTVAEAPKADDDDNSIFGL